MATQVLIMQTAIPAAVLRVCELLRSGGCEAWIVGGAVRDLVMGKTPSDWDVATDCLPERVVELFDKTIATGLQHGTVTVLMGRGQDRESVEVTTFRGEGAYSDSRRPDEVHFGVPLDEDLKRRDFVINAMAYDPLANKVHDPFGGVSDIGNRRLRAVGVASERFCEDGLRVMRAVRFVATLDFSLDSDTEKGMPSALPALARVAQERVRVELFKLLAGKAASRALVIAERNGILKVILPELAQLCVSDALARVQEVQGDPVVHLAALLAGLDGLSLEPLLRRLTMSNEERQRVLGILRGYDLASAHFDSDTQWRRLLSRVGRANAGDALAVLLAEANRLKDNSHACGITRAREIIVSDDAIEIRDLAVDGKAIMAATGAKGRSVGQLLQSLLDAVLEDPARNRPDELLSLARQNASLLADSEH